MKQISICLLLLTIIVGSCKKTDDVNPAANDVKAAVIQKPTAYFIITNPVSQGWVLEGNILDFVNKSENGDTYFWDFGNGSFSTDRIPTNLYYVPCGQVYTITLTVKNKAGDIATYSQTYNVLCRGKNAHNAPPTHITSNGG